MKQTEFTKLTKIIEILVQKEIKKQLPKLISEVFQTIAEKSIVTEHTNPIIKNKEELQEINNSNVLRKSLKDLFSDVTPVTKTSLEEGKNVSFVPKQFTKNPVLNQILNETVPDLRQRERMVGLSALQGGYNSLGEFTNENMNNTEEEINLSSNVPNIIQNNNNLTSNISEGISALDVAKTGVTSPSVTRALTDYGRMKKILDASKGKRK